MFAHSTARRWSGVIVLVALAMGATACNAVRQPYTAPVLAVPDGWSRDTQCRDDVPTLGDGSPVGAPARVAPETIDGRWWSTFDDPVMGSLIERAVAANLDVRTAVSRIREARARVRVSRADLRPTATVGASTSVIDASSQTTGGLGPDVVDSYQLSSDASWEIDIVGGRRSAVDANTATASSREDDWRHVVVTLAADVGTTYIRLRAQQERLAVARDNERVQADTYQLTQFRRLAGLVTDLDVEQARANLENTRAQLAGLRIEEVQARHALAILLGLPPTALDQELEALGRLPDAPLALAIGVPAEVVRRRPDVRSAEQRLASQAARVNEARASLYPRVNLLGSIGLEALDIAKWLIPGATFWRAAPSVSVPAFDRRRLRDNVQVQGELQEQALATLETQVLRALGEVEDALVAVAEERVRRDRLVDAVDAARRAAELAAQQYAAGLRDFRAVLDAQRTQLTFEDTLVSSRANLASGFVRLYRSAGGGWSVAPTP